MELWLDTIDIDIIKRAINMGLLFGVTTNPIILAKSSTMPSETIASLLKILPEQSPLAVQVTAETAEGMLQQAHKLRALSQRIIIKVPVTEIGLQAMKKMNQDDIPVMATAIVNAQQMVLAVEAQAKYAAPYLHAMEENSIDYRAELDLMLEIVAKQKSSTKILAASIDTPKKISECAAKSVPAITIPANTFNEFIKTPLLAELYLNKFKAAWDEKAYDKDKLFDITEQSTFQPKSAFFT